MYAIHKAQQELAVENGLSENRGRPATIPTVKHTDHQPPGIALSCKKSTLCLQTTAEPNLAQIFPLERKGLPFWGSWPGIGVWFPALP